MDRKGIGKKARTYRLGSLKLAESKTQKVNHLSPRHPFFILPSKHLAHWALVLGDAAVVEAAIVTLGLCLHRTGNWRASRRAFCWLASVGGRRSRNRSRRSWNRSRNSWSQTSEAASQGRTNAYESNLLSSCFLFELQQTKGYKSNEMA